MARERPTVKRPLEIREDDLTGEPTRALVRHHLRGMHAQSPPGSCHAFDVDSLRHPDVTFWSAWIDGQIAGMGALKRRGAADGEIKSMRVHDAFLGQGVGRAILRHIVAQAGAAGVRTLWLETGSGPGFEAAQQLYLSEGFSFCGPFGDYRDDPFSRFMTRTI
jgi:putative acetyltransferase